MADQVPHDGANEKGPALPPAAAQEPADDEAGPALAAFWEAVKRLPAYVRLAATMARDPEVPTQAKAILGVGGGYAISPIDLIPGIIPVAGQIDDVYVALTALQQALRLTPPAVADRHLAAANVRREDIETDLRAVRTLVRMAVVRALLFGGRTLGRFSQAATRFARDQFRGRRIRRTEGTR